MPTSPRPFRPHASSAPDDHDTRPEYELLLRVMCLLRDLAEDEWSPAFRRRVTEEYFLGAPPADLTAVETFGFAEWALFDRRTPGGRASLAALCLARAGGAFDPRAGGVFDPRARHLLAQLAASALSVFEVLEEDGAGGAHVVDALVPRRHHVSVLPTGAAAGATILGRVFEVDGVEALTPASLAVAGDAAQHVRALQRDLGLADALPWPLFMKQFGWCAAAGLVWSARRAGDRA